MSNFVIDINCDVGERQSKLDEVLLPYITSANLSCGAHAGDMYEIGKTLMAIMGSGVRFGAHPSYPDPEGFGRRQMIMEADDLREEIRLQIVDIMELWMAQGMYDYEMSYVKPHGALYNVMADSEAESRVVIEAMQQVDTSLALMGLAGSVTERVAAGMGVRFIAEAFADRRYTYDGRLQSRMEDGAVIADPNEAAEQALSIAQNQCVTSFDGKVVPVKARSICIHGDTPNALDILEAVHKN